MLPYVLVLLIAQSALASSVLVAVQPIEDAEYIIDDFRTQVNSKLERLVWENSLDESAAGAMLVKILQTIIYDLGDKPDKLSQSVSLCQLVTIVGELAYGRNGDACAYAEFINSLVEFNNSGNKAEFKKNFGKFVGRLEYVIDAIASVNSKSESLRYQTGPRGNCLGGGRSYQYEASWDTFLSTVNPFQIGLFNEEYCIAKRLYCAWNEVNNLVGAATTACATQPAAKLFEEAQGPVSYFLRTVVHGGNVGAAAAQAKASLVQAFSKY